MAEATVVLGAVAGDQLMEEEQIQIERGEYSAGFLVNRNWNGDCQCDINLLQR
jgi:hypothetical protein